MEENTFPGDTMTTEPNRTPLEPILSWAWLINTIGPALILCGLLILFSSWGMDTTAETVNGQRIHNTGLMQRQLIGVIVGVATACTGVIVWAIRAPRD